MHFDVLLVALPGSDCLGHIKYFDGVVNNAKGEPLVIRKAICMHEEDAGACLGGEGGGGGGPGLFCCVLRPPARQLLHPAPCQSVPAAPPPPPVSTWLPPPWPPAGLLWKHTDLRLNHVEVRRSRRLVISMISTFANYEYAMYWNFYQVRLGGRVRQGWALGWAGGRVRA